MKLAVTELLLAMALAAPGALAEAQAAPPLLSPSVQAPTLPQPRLTAQRERPWNAIYLTQAIRVEKMLRQDVLDVWFPRSVDNEHGGFYSVFSREWKPGPSQGKFSVFQGRMTWISSQVVLRRPEMRDRFLPIAQHGLQFLSDVLWDKKYGGFFWGVDDNGAISPSFGDNKEMYGESFGLYGAAAAYQATKDSKALMLAQREFHWMEEHAHDQKNGGYFELLTRDGKPVQADANGMPPGDTAHGGFIPGYKSMNTHIHLLEAMSQLYEVWKDDLVRTRLQELLTIVRDKICVEPGVMNLYFTNDWRPIPDHDSYGHDVETAYLMLEAEDVLGVPHDPRTEHMAKMLVDHALAFGWDEKLGGFYGEGTTFGKPEEKSKDWWVEMEGLNALLLMHEKYGSRADAYFNAFQKQLDFIERYQRDEEFHGFYGRIGEDGRPLSTEKGQIWKAGYHDGRALLNVSERLRKLARAK
ncbi:MAG TPA: AGE family epimerase/isomerase [Terriglobales bacterium]|nr:AGE family epimerase/isomerase [Terriglobales bacterium]